MIQPWDATLLKAIEKALLISELGINPQNDGQVIRLIFPQLTEERRRELVKACKGYAEEARVAVRNVRRDANAKIERDEENSEDGVRREQAAVQKLTDSYIKKIDELLKTKEAEVMEI